MSAVNFYHAKESVSSLSNGKQYSKITVKYNSELLGKSVTKSMPTISQGYPVNIGGTRKNKFTGYG